MNPHSKAAKVYRQVITAVFLAASICLNSCGFIVFNNGEDTTDEITDEKPTSTDSIVTGGSSDTTKAETTEAIDYRLEADKRLDALPSINLDFTNIIIASVDTNTICPSEETDVETSASRIIATSAVEKKYQTRIIPSRITAEEMLDSLKTSLASGLFYADLLAIPRNMVGSFYASGVLANLNTLPYVDIDAEYYDQAFNNDAYIANKQLAVSGAANFNPEHLSCIYFNRDIAERSGLGNIYSAVTDGSWTWDKLLEHARIASESVDNCYGIGYGYGQEAFIDSVISSMGIDFVTVKQNAAPSIDYMLIGSMSSRADFAVELLYGIIYKNSAIAPIETADQLFRDGSLLFSFDRLSKNSEYADISTSWGILPFPKYDAEQPDYISPIKADAPVWCAPRDIQNFDASGIILESLNMSYYEYVMDIYMNEQMNYYLRDNGSINMLEIITENLSSDFAQMMSSGFQYLGNATIDAVKNAVTTTSSLQSYFNAYYGAALQELTAASGIK